MKPALTIVALIAWGVMVVPALNLPFAAAESAPGKSLYARSAGQALARDFSDPAISFLLLDARSNAVLASRWDNPEKPIPVGSLVKPFTALAYAEAHDFKYPGHRCRGGQSCWRPRGHGQVGLVRATALSCNSYYTMLAAGVSAGQATAVALQFGLNGPGAVAGSDALIGKLGLWRESPMALARAYLELLRRRSQPGARELVDGMADAAKEGTAGAISRAMPHLPTVAKTGTAPCTHQQHAPGDGFVVVAWPADNPKHLLLVRKHGVPGAATAAVAGSILRTLEPQS